MLRRARPHGPARADTATAWGGGAATRAPPRAPKCLESRECVVALPMHSQAAFGTGRCIMIQAAGLLLAALSLLAGSAAPLVAAPAHTRYSGTVTMIDPQGGVMVIDEVGP